MTIVEYDVILNHEGSITMSKCFMPFGIGVESGFEFVKEFGVVNEKGGKRQKWKWDQNKRDYWGEYVGDGNR